MRAYGLTSQAPVVCCPGHTTWIVQSKYGGRPNGGRDATRRPFKKRERRAGSSEISGALEDMELEALGVELVQDLYKKQRWSLEDDLFALDLYYRGTYDPLCVYPAEDTWYWDEYYDRDDCLDAYDDPYYDEYTRRSHCSRLRA